jgi:hypothetical protein
LTTPRTPFFQAVCARKEIHDLEGAIPIRLRHSRWAPEAACRLVMPDVPGDSRVLTMAGRD